MTRQTGYDAEVRPLRPRLAQAGAPVTSAMELGHVQATEALVYNTTPTKRSWVWPHPDSAPTATVTAIGTDTLFRVGGTGSDSTALELPWYVQKGSDFVGATIIYAWNPKLPPPIVRMRIKTLVAAVSTQNSQYTGNAAINVFGNNFGMWRGHEIEWYTRAGTVRFNTQVGVSADRRIALSFLASIDPEADGSVVTYDRTVKLLALRVWDQAQLRDPTQ